jgi:hypothetical protein
VPRGALGAAPRGGVAPSGAPACNEGGNQWQSEAIRGHQRGVAPSGAPACNEGGNQWQSEAIRGHQRGVAPS